jgi:hypothetical protein
MRPSSRLFLDPVDVRENERAVRRATQLVEHLNREADIALDLPDGGKPSAKSKEPTDWELVAGVAQTHPRLLVWLAEGRVTWYWNLFGSFIAVLRLIPGPRWLMWRLFFQPVARNAPWCPELYEAILQRKRHEHNVLRPRPVELAITGTPGLSAVTEGTTLKRPAGYADLRDKIRRMSSGCIGVSGLRGSGKSTVIRDFCSERYGTPQWEKYPPMVDLPGLRLMVEAPLLYDAREFLVHLYTCLCRAVLADAKLNATSLRRHLYLAILGSRSIRLASVARLLGGIASLIVAAGLAFRAAAGRWPHPWPLWTWETIGAVLAGLIAVLAISWRTRAGLLEMGQITTLATDAEERLERLHFQRTDTRGGGGTLAGPLGNGLNVSTTHALTEQVMTLPELVDDYRDFAERVVAALQASRLGMKGASQDASDVRLVIGIDQVDQIEDAQAANVFLNELGSVFGTPHCVYLIAVSPSTLATIDRRMVPLKTASGGIFDEMVWVEPLNQEQAQDLLDYRVAGLPASFTALCYVLSGGLPRDLFRVARNIFAVHDDQSGASIELAWAAGHVISDEIQALKRRAVAHAAAQGAPVSPGMLMKLTDREWLRNCSSEPSSMSTIQAVMDQVSGMWGKALTEPGKHRDHRSAEICDNFLAGLYFLLAVHRLFTAGKDCALPDDEALGGLARARRALSENPYLAEEILRAALPQQDPMSGITLRFLRAARPATDSAAIG